MRTERVGFALCGSFCTHEKALTALKRLTEEYETVIPIVSENAAFTDTRFGTSDALLEQLEELTGHEVLYDIPSVEPLGPKGMIDVLVIAPCTGNTLAKLAHGITDKTTGIDNDDICLILIIGDGNAIFCDHRKHMLGIDQVLITAKRYKKKFHYASSSCSSSSSEMICNSPR